MTTRGTASPLRLGLARQIDLMRGFGRCLRRVLIPVAILWCSALPAADGVPDLSGIWIGSRDGGQERDTRTPDYTAAGRQILEGYDLFVDDPGYSCSPASISRLWDNPTPTEIVQYDDRVVLIHEYLDFERSIPLDQESHASGLPARQVGHSIGRYEGSTLIIDTIGYSSGYISTITGIPQTESLHTVERLTLSSDGNSFVLEITNDDPVAFASPWVTTRTYVHRLGLTRLPFDCVLEDASYEEF